METTSEYKTIEDFKKYPEGTTVELIDGKIIELPRRLIIHQDVLSDIAINIWNKIKSNLIKGKLINWVDVYLDEKTIVQPDLIYVSHENFNILHDYVFGVTDMLIEIISPTGMAHDFITKYNLYKEYGVKEYFIINPDDKLVICYRLQNNVYKEAYRGDGILKSEEMNAEIEF
ncbi:MAG: Uma2 family endonuclease [Bacteroidia bacterium]